jgi:N-acetylneuraminate synthase
MSTFHEIENTINWIKKFNNKISIFQCTSSYPISPEEWGLNIINEMKNKYSYPIGFSDHSGDIFASLSASLLGVELLEFHAVFHKEIFGPDTKASLTLDQISLLTKGVRQIEIAKKNDVHKENIEKFVDMKIIFGKSLCVNKKLSKGNILTIHDLDAKKPAKCGISAAEYDRVIGKKLKQDLNKWDFLNDNMIH